MLSRTTRLCFVCLVFPARLSCSRGANDRTVDDFVRVASPSRRVFIRTSVLEEGCTVVVLLVLSSGLTMEISPSGMDAVKAFCGRRTVSALESPGITTIPFLSGLSMRTLCPHFRTFSTTESSETITILFLEGLRRSKFPSDFRTVSTTESPCVTRVLCPAELHWSGFCEATEGWQGECPGVYLGLS